MQGFGLFKMKGISFKVHPSWWLILILLTLSSQGQFAREFGDQLPDWQSWYVGVLTSSLLFSSVFLCELGRYYIALNEGIEVGSIKLFLFSGLTRIDDKSANPISNFRIAISGPFLSLLIAFLCILFVNLNSNIDPITFYSLRQIGRFNLLLAFFNLLPILPLNGGIVIKSLAWHFTKNQRKGHLLANNTGRYLSFFSIFVGSIIIFSSGGVNGVLFLILGWFGLSSSKSQEQTIILQDALLEIFIEDALGKKFRFMDENKSLKLLSKMRLSSSEQSTCSEWVLLSNSGRWVGYITDQPLKDIPAKDWENYSLSNYKRPLAELPSIQENNPIWHAVLKLEKIKEGRLLVFNIAGLPSGTIDKADLGEKVLKKLGIVLPRTFIELARKNNNYPLGISLPKIVEGMLDSGLIKKSEFDRLTK